LSEADSIRSSTHDPVTIPLLVTDLHALGLRAGMTVLVHSSLSKLGWVCGGAAAVILALESILGAQGTLVMPTHSSDLSDPALWQNPPVPESWWQTIRQTMPAFQPDLTPTRGMGAIPECFRGQQGVQRSSHPAVSFAARGPLAHQITDSHALNNSLGDDSPLARLYEVDGWVLLLGVDHSNNTSLHLAEHRAEFQGKTTMGQGAPVIVNGAREWITYSDVDWNDADFPQIGCAFESTGQVTVGPVGYGEGRLMRQRALVDFAVQWMQNNRT
jgi:aminoglycoside 3-N-acetyltransferase